MKSGISNFAIIGALAGGYYLAALLGHRLEMGSFQSAPVWPPTGLGLGAMLCLGQRVWPAVLVGAFLGHAASPEMAAVSPWQAILASIFAASGSTAAITLGAWLTNRYANGVRMLAHPNDFCRFIVISAAGATVLSPTLGVVGQWAAGLHGFSGSGPLWLHWWLGEAVSAVVITPFIIAWGTRAWAPLRRRLPETLAMGTLLLVAAALLFSSTLAVDSSELDFLVIPLLLWAALRLGHRAASTTVLVLACVATFGTFDRINLLPGEGSVRPLLVLQAFIAIIAMMSSMVAAGAWQRSQAENALLASEDAYRQLFESNPQPICVCDQQTGRFLAVNSAAQRAYGHSLQEFLKLSWPDLQITQEPTSLEGLTRAVSPGQTTSLSHRRIGGSPIHVEVVWHPLSFKAQPAVLLVCTDVTQRREAEKRASVFTNLGERLSLARTEEEAARTILQAARRLFVSDTCSFTSLLSVPARQVVVPAPEPALAAVSGEPQTELHPHEMTTTIRCGEHAIARLAVRRNSLEPYCPEEERALDALAEHCAGALERIRAEEEIARLNRELRLHLEELQALLAVAPVGIAVSADIELSAVSLNEACRSLFGITGAQDFTGILERGSSAPCLLYQEGSPLPAASFPMRLAARRATSLEKQELEIRFRDGRRIYCYAYAIPLFGDYGEVRGSLGIFVDLTARKEAEDEILRLNSELEQRVRDRTLQLESINKELEAFSYSVSHDLRAPLRSVRGFSEVLLERYSGLLDDSGQDFLRRVCNSCAHMDRLIEDLLKLSRVGRAELLAQDVDLSRLAHGVLGELGRAEPARQISLRVADGLHARGDERLLRVALDNLLRNSWKFTRKTAHPEIDFGYTSNHGGAFFIRDNGAGFDPAYSSRLFSVFQRLHSAAEFPGTGVGLATVQRIIRRHGGNTWATGRVNEGACFYFTLPESGQRINNTLEPSAIRGSPVAEIAEHLNS